MKKEGLEEIKQEGPGMWISTGSKYYKEALTTEGNSNRRNRRSQWFGSVEEFEDHKRLVESSDLTKKNITVSEDSDSKNFNGIERTQPPKSEYKIREDIDKTMHLIYRRPQIVPSKRLTNQSK